MSNATLTWSYDLSADSYSIYRSESMLDVNNLPTPLVTGLIVQKYSDNTTVVGTTYYYLVQAVSGTEVKNSSVYSTTITSDLRINMDFELNYQNDVTREEWSVYGTGVSLVYPNLSPTSTALQTDVVSYLYHTENLTKTFTWFTQFKIPILPTIGVVPIFEYGVPSNNEDGFLVYFDSSDNYLKTLSYFNSVSTTTNLIPLLDNVVCNIQIDSTTTDTTITTNFSNMFNLSNSVTNASRVIKLGSGTIANTTSTTLIIDNFFVK